MSGLGLLWRWVLCVSIAVLLSYALAKVVPMDEPAQALVSFLIGGVAGLIAFKWWRA